MTKAKDELTTQSDNTLDEILEAFELFVVMEDKPSRRRPQLTHEEAKQKLTKWRDDAVQTAQLDLLTRLEAEPSIADLFPTHPENNPDGYDDMVSVVKWYKSKLQSERALIEKRMM